MANLWQNWAVWVWPAINLASSIFLALIVHSAFFALAKHLAKRTGSPIENSLQVGEATEHTLQNRALTSASNAPKAWDLRCLVREKLIKFLQENYPERLPRARADVHGISPYGQPIEGTPFPSSFHHQGELNPKS
jgi:hypothetical protein